MRGSWEIEAGNSNAETRRSGVLRKTEFTAETRRRGVLRSMEFNAEARRSGVLRKTEFTTETRRRGVLRTHSNIVGAAPDLGSSYISLFFSASPRLCGEMIASLFFSASQRLRVEMTFRDRVTSC